MRSNDRGNDRSDDRGSRPLSAIIDKKAIFAGCARNCAEHLPRVLDNIGRMAGLFAAAAFVFAENDSTDATRHELRRWCGARPAARLIARDGLDAWCPVRTIQLARMRSEYLALVKTELSEADYLFVLDCDEVNTLEIDLFAVARAVDFLARGPSRAGVFANSDGVYYDMWALRHPAWCPGDVWEEVLDQVIRFGVSDSEAFARTFAKRVRRIAPNAPPIEVDSAFGGLAIYKVTSILKNRRTFVGYKTKQLPMVTGAVDVGLQTCEHVSFSAGFRELGEQLFILPDLVNYRTENVTFPPQAFRSMIFDLRLAATVC
jgi:hypothetical protein